MKVKGLKRGYDVVIKPTHRIIDITNAKGMVVWTKAFGFAGSNISCGVSQMNGVPSDAVLNRFKEQLTEKANELEVFQEIFTQFIKEIKTSYRSAMILMSNNKGNGAKFNSVLDKMALTSHGYVKNPNSGNQIKVWVL